MSYYSKTQELYLLFGIPLLQATNYSLWFYYTLTVTVSAQNECATLPKLDMLRNTLKNKNCA